MDDVVGHDSCFVVDVVGHDSCFVVDVVGHDSCFVIDVVIMTVVLWLMSLS